MGKWADYLISAVQYDPEHLHIEKVRIHKDTGDKVGQASESSHREVIANIKNKKTYITIYEGQSNKWKKGEVVRIIVVDGTEYIRTDRNQKKSDNLGDLPEF
jgi:hypothetical protein